MLDVCRCCVGWNAETKPTGGCAGMPCFHFHLRTQGTLHPDPDGSECRDHAAARLHAERVATELMRNAEEERKLWSLRVEDWDGGHVFDVFFADVISRTASAGT